jgi:curved DNA-binding protein
VHLTFEQAFAGTELELVLAAIEYDEEGRARRVPHRMKVRVPSGVADGQKLRVPGKAAGRVAGARRSQHHRRHPVFTSTAWTSTSTCRLTVGGSLGASVELPTPAGRVTLKVPAGTRAGQRLRLGGRGMARPDGTKGDLYAQAQIAVPTVIDEPQRKLYEQLRDASSFDPRAHLG